MPLQIADMIMALIIVMDVGLTIINVAILGLAIKLYTDQAKQALLRRQNK